MGRKHGLNIYDFRAQEWTAFGIRIKVFDPGTSFLSVVSCLIESIDISGAKPRAIISALIVLACH
jgi:hypothetical protein